MRAIKSAAPFYRRKSRPAPPAVLAKTLQIKTSVGEVGIHEAGGREIILRPSLYAMSQLGEPEEIVRLLASVCSDPVSPAEARLQHLNVIAVLAACTTEDIRRLTGYHDGTVLVLGRMEIGVMLILARRLLQHGVTGTLPEEKRPAGAAAPEYTDKFDARAYVAMGMAHLSLSEDDAWRMTMTGLVGAMRSKYPPAEPAKDPNQPGGQAPTKDETLATMAWFDKIDKARKMKADQNG
jgi:hypothetical protein